MFNIFLLHKKCACEKVMQECNFVDKSVYPFVKIHGFALLFMLFTVDHSKLRSRCNVYFS